MKHPKSARHLSRLLAWHVERRARHCTILQGCGRSGKSFLVSLWGIAQLVRTPACHAGGRSDLNPFGCQKVNDWIYFRHADFRVLIRTGAHLGLLPYSRPLARKTPPTPGLFESTTESYESGRVHAPDIRPRPRRLSVRERGEVAARDE